MLFTLRDATGADVAGIAALHADSWRRHYRGAYTDTYLDGDVVADRLAFWGARFAAPPSGRTIVAESDGDLVGFVHVIPDHDPRWGSLVDNLHVSYARKRGGLGTRLLSAAAQTVGSRPMYLWVLQQNTAAQAFYESRGGTRVESGFASPPGGDPARLNGTPGKYRIHWPDAAGAFPAARGR
ncbi:N-acetyltransferase [Paractinoplanes deccanensis]|uniref:N-acetyltransferase n=1 Tax=Paractinoplanes deccanensis TaxID=113561 RepID=A0ABQ3XZA2_9ACTN|nr:GNAT family N-acetyltransferase [Actinoplanes deccanensis]GID73091.1 N-acetyltransferase [Actinoplanes deccanensis]